MKRETKYYLSGIICFILSLLITTFTFINLPYSLGHLYAIFLGSITGSLFAFALVIFIIGIIVSVNEDKKRVLRENEEYYQKMQNLVKKEKVE